MNPRLPTSADSLNAALRSLHEPDIINAKRVAAQRLLDTVPDNGGRFELTEEDANAWVAAVNDVRLTSGQSCSISGRRGRTACRLTTRWPCTSTSTSG